jgi:hypothetical protein
MKIRSGFVSNSSSSSFLVIFPREPKNEEDVKNMLFNRDQSLYGYYDDFFPIEQVAKTVWNDICSQEKNDIEGAIELLRSGGSDDAPSYYQYEHIEDWRERSERYGEDLDEYSKRKIKEFFNLRKMKIDKINGDNMDESVLYSFSYSDNDGSYGSALENGGLFDKLKHIEINQH